MKEFKWRFVVPETIEIKNARDIAKKSMIKSETRLATSGTQESLKRREN